jgi:hypothetical protein
MTINLLGSLHPGRLPFFFLEADMNEYAHSANVSDELSQLVLNGFDSSAPKPSKKHKVAETLAMLRQLQDELNAQLYSHPTEQPSYQSVLWFYTY